jgi:hypothetical protein
LPGGGFESLNGRRYFLLWNGVEKMGSEQAEGKKKCSPPGSGVAAYIVNRHQIIGRTLVFQ